jgi:hypothetical protein
MVKRLHSAAKYELKYDGKADFNDQQDRINTLIDARAEGYCSYDDDIYFSDTVSANRANLPANVDKIIHPDENWEWQETVDYNIEKLEKDGYTRESIYKSLKVIIEQSDSNCEDVHFAWF